MRLQGRSRRWGSTDGMATIDQQTTFAGEVCRIADDIAANHADDVDKEARFPTETFDALRNAGALSALVPESLGGAGLGIADAAAASFVLGRRCGASGLVFAMHQIQVACLVRHCDGSNWFD